MLPHLRSVKASSSRSLSEGDIVKKRACGELTCAECKRLKLKCDKKLPCSSCVRRGCSKTCPQGSFILDQGSSSRMEPLHRQISAMHQRIRQLEDALASLQASVSSDTHPLLRDDLLSVKFGPQALQAEDAMDAFGTLAIGGGGESRYFGSSGGSETLLMAHADSDPKPTENQSEPPMISDVLNRLACMFPMGAGCATDPQEYEDAIDMLLDCLPPTPRAWSLLEAYMEHTSYLLQPVTKEGIIEDFLTPIYDAKKEREDTEDFASTARTQISPHKLAVLFMVFATGANLDFTLPLNNKEGDNYHQYARAALTHGSGLDSPLMETVQALLLMAHYRGTADKHSSRDSSWVLTGVACKLAQSLGLHRDPGRWSMDEKTANKRRRLFWELCSLDMFISITMGRPPSIELSYVDCAFPQDTTEPEAQFWSWKYQWVKEVFGPVVKATLAAEASSYKTILELDRKVRAKTLPPTLTAGYANNNMSADTYLQCAMLSQFRTLVLLYLHQSFFAQALLDHPENPLLSRYAPSFLAASSCASDIIRDSRMHLEIMPRWWTMWTHLFSAAMVVGSIVTSAPASNLAPKAYLDLAIAIDLFAKDAHGNPRARRAMEILVRLHKKASGLFKQSHDGSHAHSLSPASKMTTPNRQGVTADELAIFGGQTRVLFTKMYLHGPPPNLGGTGDVSLARQAASANISSTSQNSVSFLDLESSFKLSLSSTSHSGSSAVQEYTTMGMQGVHPSLMEYISMLPSDSTTFSSGSISTGSPPSSSHRHLWEQPTGTMGLSQSHLATKSDSPIPGFNFHQQPPADYSTRTYRGQSQDDCAYDPTLFGPFEHFYRQAASTSNSSAEAMEERDIKHLDMVLKVTAGSGDVNDCWMFGDQWKGPGGAAHDCNSTFNST